MKTEIVHCKTCGNKIVVRKDTVPGAFIVFSSLTNKIRLDSENLLLYTSEDVSKLNVMAKTDNAIVFNKLKDRSLEEDELMSQSIFNFPIKVVKEFKKVGIYLTCDNPEEQHEHKYDVYM